MVDDRSRYIGQPIDQEHPSDRMQIRIEVSTLFRKANVFVVCSWMEERTNLVGGP